MDSVRQKAFNDLKEIFIETPDEYTPCSYSVPSLPVNPNELRRELSKKKKNGMRYVIPELMKSGKAYSREEILDFYKIYFDICSSLGLKTFFNFEAEYENMILDESSEYDTSSYAKILNFYSYRCFENEKLSYNLHRGVLMSIVAYDGYMQIRDLREFIDGDVLRWDVPRGNWEILEFVCMPDTYSGRIDYLDYRHSLNYLSVAAEYFGGITGASMPESVVGIKYNDIGFVGKNRRMWCGDFNRIFEEKYDFDPAPFYPALFFDIGPDTARLKAQFFNCRSEIFQNGFIKAARDFASEYDIDVIGGLIEPKLTACSQTVGDAMLSNAFSPSALMDKAYLYGINSIKIAAGTAYNFDCATVSCDLFRDYMDIDLDIAYKDAMHSLARGANSLFVHSPKFEDSNAPSIKKMIFGEDNTAAFAKFISKVQAVLRGGRHVADIALLYPIYSLHSSVYFYDYDTTGFEYPSTPASADYMSVINSISIYSGHDLTVIHPKTLNKHCHANAGCLYLDNEINKEKYSILVLPSTSVISIKSLEIISEFFDCGGKIIATGSLPSYALESTKDKNLDGRVKELVAHVFGEDASDSGIMRDYCLNTNINGGMAYTLYHSLTAADGTGMTNSATLTDALESFGVPFDVSIPNMMRYEATGSLNTIYPVFKKLGLTSHFSSGGMINHIHKKRGDIDIYYVSNTTDNNFTSKVKLRGEMFIEEWNPHTGKMRRLASSYSSEKYKNVDIPFTEVSLDIPAARSVILIGTPIN